MVNNEHVEGERRQSKKRWAKRVCSTMSILRYRKSVSVAEYCMITSTSSSDVAVINVMHYLFRIKLVTARELDYNICRQIVHSECCS